jgi:predicted dehydrogenase
LAPHIHPISFHFYYTLFQRKTQAFSLRSLRPAVFCGKIFQKGALHMIRYAILGTSWISQEFYAASLSSEMELAAVCSRSEKKGRLFAQTIGRPELKVYTSVEALAAAAGIEAAYIASPNSCHYLQSELLLRGSKHVLCEKTACPHPAQLEHLHSMARERGLVFMEAIMYLHTATRAAVKMALPRLGEITGAQFDFSQLSSRYDAYKAGQLPNIFNPALAAGGWNDLGVYCIYPALDFFGTPRSVTAKAQLLPSGADGAGTAVLEYPDFLVTLTWSKLGQSRGVSQVFGGAGTLAIESISQLQGITLFDRAGHGEALAQPQQKTEVMQAEAQAFCAYISGCATTVGYEEATQLSLDAARWMERTRRQFGAAAGKKSHGVW